MKLAVIFSAVVLAAQTPDVVKVDTDQVRASIVTKTPHQPGARYEDIHNRLLIFLGNGEMRFTSASGKVEKAVVKTGDVRWRPASSTQVSENVSARPLPVVEIELKNHPQPFVPSELDPLKTDPKHYTLEFENDQVRVLRVRYAPHEKGTRHEHQLNHVVIYLTDHAKGPARTVKIEGPDIHSEENPLDHPVERIAVDLK